MNLNFFTKWHHSEHILAYTGSSICLECRHASVQEVLETGGRGKRGPQEPRKSVCFTYRVLPQDRSRMASQDKRTYTPCHHAPLFEISHSMHRQTEKGFMPGRCGFTSYLCPHKLWELQLVFILWTSGFLHKRLGDNDTCQPHQWRVDTVKLLHAQDRPSTDLCLLAAPPHCRLEYAGWASWRRWYHTLHTHLAVFLSVN